MSVHHQPGITMLQWPKIKKIPSDDLKPKGEISFPSLYILAQPQGRDTEGEAPGSLASEL